MYVCVLLVILSVAPFGLSQTSLDIDSHPNSWKLPKKECGYGASSDRIIGGREAALGQFPWIARLGYKMKHLNKIMFLCGGSLINQWYVVSAKHCMDAVLASSLKTIRLGDNFVEEHKDCELGVCAPPVQDIGVASYTNNGVGGSTYGDICLIKLERAAEFNDFVFPICLPTSSILQNLDQHLSLSTELEVAGWGTTATEASKVPNKLMHVNIPIVDMSICKSLFPSKRLDKSQICVGIGEGKDSCVGDSGGPLMKAIPSDDGPKYYLMGLVSYGVKWCGVNAAVYTSIAYFLPWILDNLE